MGRQLAAYFRQQLQQLPSNASRRQTRAMIQSIVNTGNPTDNTRIVRYSHVKQYLRDHKPGLERHVCVPQALVDRVVTQRENTQSNRRNIRIQQSWLDTILQWHKSDDMAKRYAYLQLVSGRRINEIHRSRFKQRGQYISTRELSKKRDRSDECTFALFPGVAPGKWLSLLKRTRQFLGSTTLEAIAQRVNRTLRLLDTQLTSHKLRGMYATMMWEYSDRALEKTAFIRKALCLESQEVAIHYNAFLPPK